MNYQRYTPTLLVITATTLVGGASGSLGGVLFAVIGAIVGALWGVGLVLVVGRLSRSPSRRQTWANATLFTTVVFAGLITGVGFLSLLMMNAALNAQPQFFADMIRGPIGDAEALPFFLFNTPLEWILVPAVLLLTWNDPRRRRLMLAALILWTFHRVWSYTYFIPEITDWSEGAAGTPMTAEQLVNARTWVNLSWIHNAFDLATMVLTLLASFRNADRTDSAPPVHHTSEITVAPTAPTAGPARWRPQDPESSGRVVPGFNAAFIPQGWDQLYG